MTPTHVFVLQTLLCEAEAVANCHRIQVGAEREQVCLLDHDYESVTMVIFILFPSLNLFAKTLIVFSLVAHNLWFYCMYKVTVSIWFEFGFTSALMQW